MGWDDGEEVYYGHPDTYTNMIASVTSHNATVLRTDGPNIGEVTLSCPSLGWPDSMWIQSHSFSGGSRIKGISQTGLYLPLQPKQPITVSFLGGNVQKPTAHHEGGGVIMFGEGSTDTDVG